MMNQPLTVEQVLAVAAGVGLFVLPHVLALLSRGRSRALLAGAGACAVTMTVLCALDVILLLPAVPLELIPGIVYLGNAGRPGPGSGGKAVLAVLLPALLVMATASVVFM